MYPSRRRSSPDVRGFIDLAVIRFPSDSGAAGMAAYQARQDRATPEAPKSLRTASTRDAQPGRARSTDHYSMGKPMPDHADRVLPLRGASNFRDLGGYVGRDGLVLRWRRLFRSDHLAGLSADDHATLAGIGLAQSFDFRGDAERAAAPYQLAGVRVHALAIEPTVVERMQQITDSGQALTAEVTAGLMRDLYQNLVSTQAPRFAQMFEQLLQTDAPVVMHCTAGKDRTGVACALLLLALGVPRGVVMQDYLLSNRHYRRPAVARSDLPPEALAVMWQVQAGFLDAALEIVDQTPGGIDSYFSQRLGLTPAALDELAARYLHAG